MDRNSFTFIAVLAVALLFSQQAFSHEGHDDAPGEEGDTMIGGPIVLSPEAIKNLELVAEEAEVRTLEDVFTVLGNIRAIPKRSAAVSSRIAGRITELLVVEGEPVKKGQVLLEVESRLLGNPPPLVKLTAPRDGIVVDRHIVLGDAVEPDTHLLEVLDLSEVYAEGLIFEGQIARVKLGQKVRIYVESYPAETFVGTVDLISGKLDPDTRALRIAVRVNNPDLKLLPNMRARLNIITGTADSVVAVAHRAVLGAAGNLFVFVQSDTDELIFEKRLVVTGMRDDRYVEIIEGVYPTEKVVTVGNYQLQYVTSRKQTEKSIDNASHDNLSTAVDGNEGMHAGRIVEELGGTSTLLLVVIALLLLNAILLIKRKRPGHGISE